VGKIDVFRRPSTLRIDGASCVPWMWAKFNPRRSSEQKGATLFRDQILNNFVSHSVPAGFSPYLLIEELAIHATTPILDWICLDLCLRDIQRLFQWWIRDNPDSDLRGAVSTVVR
jgi:hypothetical protein